MYYVLGLGNPGTQYENTRHNVGRDFLQYLAKEEGWGDWEKNKHAQALHVRGVVSDVPIECLLPETYMNRSGETVRYLAQKHHMKPEELIVVYDDVDLAIGELKISKGRGAGGHNGVESVINALGSKDFIRLRIGVAPRGFFGIPKRPKGEALTGHVLGRFTKKEQLQLDKVFAEAHQALRMTSEEGVESAMNTYNR